MARSKKYEDWLIENLKDHDEAVAYLNAALEESLVGEESQEVLLMAIKDVVKAHGGIGKIAKKTQLGRESLYKTLSEKDNLKLSTILSLINSLGLKLRFT
jgi:probable addiction module antidote protein